MKISRFVSSQLAVSLFIGISVFSSSSLSAAVLSLKFDDGSGTSLYDQYTGRAGGGWAGAWTVGRSYSDLTYSANVSSSAPLYSGGGNYLKASITSNGTSSSTQQGAWRRQVDSSAIDLTEAFTYSFYFRPDSTPGSSGDSAQYMIFTSSQTENGTSSRNTWAIISSAADSSVWMLQNGGNTVSSDMAVTAGTVYFFTINTDPQTQTYNVTIFNGTNTYTSPSLGWRSAATQEGAFLHFTVKDTTAGTINTVGFSVDGISLTQVPEPAMVALLTGICALAIIGGSRLRRQN